MFLLNIKTKNKMKQKFLIMMLCIITSQAFSQSITTINIANDTVINSTVIVDGNKVIINGNGKNVVLNGVPKFKVINNGVLLVKNMKIANRKNWGVVEQKSELQWYNVGMKGWMIKLAPVSFNPTNYIDGSMRNNP